ncbi:MAG: hypothetical protein IJF53_07285 [Clostridia bacterium]|nr:hypothetical protein [Clostridia bacterium]
MDRPNLSRIFTFFELCLIFLFGVGLILFTKDVSAAASEGIHLALTTVIPSLFPFFVLSTFLTSSGMGARLSRLFSLPMRYLFRLPQGCAPAIVLGAIGGYPTGARTAFELCDSGICTKEECARLLGFCSLCGPAFIFSMARSLTGDIRFGLIIWLSHLASALIIGIISAIGKPVPKAFTYLPPPRKQKTAKLFTSSVSSSFSAIINVSGFVIFFSAIMPLLNKAGLFSALSGIVPADDSGIYAALLRGAFEMTGGVSALASERAALPQMCSAAAFIIGWGGLSVHCQVLSLMDDRSVPMGRYFTGKLAQGALSAAITYWAASQIPTDAPAWMPIYSPPYYVASPLGFIILMGIYLLLAFGCSALVVWLDERQER